MEPIRGGHGKTEGKETGRECAGMGEMPKGLWGQAPLQIWEYPGIHETSFEIVKNLPNLMKDSKKFSVKCSKRCASWTGQLPRPAHHFPAPFSNWYVFPEKF